MTLPGNQSAVEDFSSVLPLHYRPHEIGGLPGLEPGPLLP